MPAPAKSTTKPKAARPRVEVPTLTFQADANFKPVTAKAADNPYSETVANAVVGAFYPFPENLDSEVIEAIVRKLRSAGQSHGVSIHVRKDAVSGRTGWKVAGPIKVRGPRKAKAA